MGKLIFNFCMALIFIPLSFISSDAQTLPSTEDSIKTLICKKWEVDYAKFDKELILRGPTAPKMFFEFKIDKTFTMQDDGDKEVVKGTWKYDVKKRIINLSQANRPNFMSVTGTLNANIVMKMNESGNAPADIGEMELILKEQK